MGHIVGSVGPHHPVSYIGLSVPWFVETPDSPHNSAQPVFRPICGWVPSPQHPPDVIHNYDKHSYPFFVAILLPYNNVNVNRE